MNLEGKRFLITGVATRHSIAFAIAREAQLAGAEVILTSFGRVRSLTERAARKLPEAPDILELDLSSEEGLDDLTGELRSRWGRVDGAVHAVAYAPQEAFGGNLLECPPESAEVAFRVGAFSLKSLTRAVAPLMPSGGSVVGLDFDASVTWFNYDWMGVSKAALEAVSRYLAMELGPRDIRVNLIAAGPIHTMASAGIPGVHHFEDAWHERTPLTWDLHDPTPIAHTALFLLSDWARKITGEIVHVDGGFHAVGFRQSREEASQPADDAESEAVAGAPV